MPGTVVYLGSFDDILSTWEWDSLSRRLIHLSNTHTPSPSWLTLSHSGEFLFSTNEVNVYEDQPVGAVSSFQIHPDTGLLSAINAVPCDGKSPTHVTVNAKDSLLYVSNYSSGSFSIVPVDRSGVLSPTVQHIVHNGDSR